MSFKAVWNIETLPPLQPSQVHLHMYRCDTIPTLGMMHVSVQHNQQARQLPLLIVKGDGLTLLGRDWLTQLRLDIDWSSVYHVQTQHTLFQLLHKHSSVFADDLGTVQEVTLHVDPAIQPKYYKARLVPFAIRPKVEDELDRLLAAGVIEPVRYCLSCSSDTSS